MIRQRNMTKGQVMCGCFEAKGLYTRDAKLQLVIPHSASLKDKRRVAKSLIDKTRHRFNVSIAQLDADSDYRHLTLAVAVTSGSLSHAYDSLNQVISFVEEQGYNLGAELINEDIY